MAERFKPWVDPATGELIEHQAGLIWWETIDERYQVEVQESILPNVANFLVFDTSNGDKILKNEIIAVGAEQTPEEAREIWRERALTVISEQPEEG